MLMMLFKGMNLCTSNNGYLSQWLIKGHGINQGCPGLPLVYTYCGEILNHLVKSNGDIKGIPIDSLKIVLSQFTDDTTVFLKFEQITLEAFSNTLQCVETLMGLKVSYEKTTLYRVGSIQESEAKLYTQKDLAWSNKSMQTLGIGIRCDGGTDESKFDNVIKKLHQVCSSWINRKLSLSGKVLVVNTLMKLLVHI